MIQQEYIECCAFRTTPAANLCCIKIYSVMSRIFPLSEVSYFWGKGGVKRDFRKAGVRVTSPILLDLDLRLFMSHTSMTYIPGSALKRALHPSAADSAVLD